MIQDKIDKSLKINRGFYYDNIPSCFNPLGQSIEFLLKLWLCKLYNINNLDFTFCSYSTKHAMLYFRWRCWLSYFSDNKIYLLISYRIKLEILLIFFKFNHQPKLSMFYKTCLFLIESRILVSSCTRISQFYQPEWTILHTEVTFSW